MLSLRGCGNVGVDPVTVVILKKPGSDQSQIKISHNKYEDFAFLLQSPLSFCIINYVCVKDGERTSLTGWSEVRGFVGDLEWTL